MLNELADLAKSVGCSQAQLALAWTIANQDVSVALLGFTKLEQIHENMKAIEVLKKWSQDLEDKCNKILDNTPVQEFDMCKYAPIPNRRQAQLYKA